MRLLLLGAVLDEQRTDQADAVIGDPRTAQPPPLLDIYNVLARRQAHAAVLPRPGRRQPALFCERVVPVRDLVEQRPLLAHVAQTRRTVRLDPGPELVPEILVCQLVAVRRHHTTSLNTGSRF